MLLPTKIVVPNDAQKHRMSTQVSHCLANIVIVLQSDIVTAQPQPQPNSTSTRVGVDKVLSWTKKMEMEDDPNFALFAQFMKMDDDLIFL